MARYGTYIVESLLGLLIFVLLLRYLLSVLRSSRLTILEYSIKVATDWIVVLFARMPHLRGYDLGVLLTAWLVNIVLTFLLLLLAQLNIFDQPQVAIPLIIALGTLKMVKYLVQLYMFIIIIGVICSFMRVQEITLRLTVMALFDRYMRPYRRFIPPIGYFDLSPMAALFVAQLVLFICDDSLRTVSAMFL